MTVMPNRTIETLRIRGIQGSRLLTSLCSLCLGGLILFSSAPAADDKPAATPEAPLFSAMKYRLVGPFRGGRSCAVTDPEECFATEADAQAANYRAPVR